MLEYAALTSSDPADLARQMTERSAQGWEILHIVSSGATITAFARRAAIAASAPAQQAATQPAPQAAQTSSWASTNTSSTNTPATASTPVASTSTASSVGDALAPAAWYPDPAGRFELRYWNGTAWTEHVSRNGQQSTDAPVA